MITTCVEPKIVNTFQVGFQVGVLRQRIIANYSQLAMKKVRNGVHEFTIQN
jgi:hypothetical protein